MKVKLVFVIRIVPQHGLRLKSESVAKHQRAWTLFACYNTLVKIFIEFSCLNGGGEIFSFSEVYDRLSVQCSACKVKVDLVSVIRIVPAQFKIRK